MNITNYLLFNCSNSSIQNWKITFVNNQRALIYSLSASGNITLSYQLLSEECSTTQQLRNKNTIIFPQITLLTPHNLLATWIEREKSSDNAIGHGLYLDLSGNAISAPFKLSDQDVNFLVPSSVQLSENNLATLWIEQSASASLIKANNARQTTFNSSQNILIANNTAGSLLFSTLTASTNKILIAWQKQINSTNNDWDVYTQFYDFNFANLSQPTRINDYTNDVQGRPAVASTNNTFLISWNSGGQIDNADIFFKILDNNGNIILPETLANTYTLGSQNIPQVAGVNGIYGIVWTSNGQDGDQGGIYTQLLYSNGTKIGNELRLNSETIGSQRLPQVWVEDDNLAFGWLSPYLGRDVLYGAKIDTKQFLDTTPTHSQTQTLSDTSKSKKYSQSSTQTASDTPTLDTDSQSKTQTLSETSPTETDSRSRIQTLSDTPTSEIDSQSKTQTLSETSPTETDSRSKTQTLSDTPTSKIDSQSKTQTLSKTSPTETDSRSRIQTLSDTPTSEIDSQSKTTSDTPTIEHTISHTAAASSVVNTDPQHTISKAQTTYLTNHTRSYTHTANEHTQTHSYEVDSKSHTITLTNYESPSLISTINVTPVDIPLKKEFEAIPKRFKEPIQGTMTVTTALGGTISTRNIIHGGRLNIVSRLASCNLPELKDNRLSPHSWTFNYKIFLGGFEAAEASNILYSSQLFWGIITLGGLALGYFVPPTMPYVVRVLVGTTLFISPIMTSSSITLIRFGSTEQKVWGGLSLSIPLILTATSAFGLYSPLANIKYHNGVVTNSAFVKNFGILFNEYKQMWRGWVAVENLVSISAGILEGLSVNGNCRIITHAGTAIYSSYALSMVVVRPFYIKPGTFFYNNNNIIYSSIGILQSLPFILSSLKIEVSDLEDNENIDTAIEAISLVTNVALFALTIKDLIEFATHYYQKLKHRKQDSHLLDNNYLTGPQDTESATPPLAAAAADRSHQPSPISDTVAVTISDPPTLPRHSTVDELAFELCILDRNSATTPLAAAADRSHQPSPISDTLAITISAPLTLPRHSTVDELAFELCILDRNSATTPLAAAADPTILIIRDRDDMFSMYRSDIYQTPIDDLL
jgi:hypothetical protein